MQLEVMTPAETADFLRCSLSYVHKAARAGKIPVHRLGTDYRFIRTELLEWLANEKPPQQAHVEVPAVATPKPKPKPAHPLRPGPSKFAATRVQKKRAVLRALRDQATIKAAAKTAGVSTVTIRNWRNRDPQFDAQVQAIQQQACAAPSAPSDGATLFTLE